MYEIQSEKSLRRLCALLDKNDVQYDLQSENRILIRDEAKQKERASAAIGEHISSLVVKKIVDREIKKIKRTLEPSFRKEFMSRFLKDRYWQILTSVVVSNFFEYEKKIHIEPFVLFNLRGFSHELTKKVRASILEALGEAR